VADWFELRGIIPKKQKFLLELCGFVVVLAVWQLMALKFNSEAILPSPLHVVKAYAELHFNDFLIRNVLYSIKLNLIGYIEAICIAVPLGLTIGLFPFFNALWARYVDGIRFLPLTAVTGIFIAWFGIGILMKTQFLTLGIVVFLLPIVVQRVSEVEDVYVQTAYTLGANKWQTIVRVFIPHVSSHVFDNIRVIVATSWTYIIVAEMVNNEGGVGAMIFRAARQCRLDKVFAILFLIIAIGIVQDKIFLWLDRLIFKYKYSQEELK